MEKTKSTQRSYQQLGLLVFLLGSMAACCFFILLNLNVLRQRSRLLRQINDIEQKIDALNIEQEKIQTWVLQKNSNYSLEKYARENMGLQKEGESAVAFPVSENK